MPVINRSITLVSSDGSENSINIVEREGNLQLVAKDIGSEELVSLKVSKSDAVELAEWLLVVADEYARVSKTVNSVRTGNTEKAEGTANRNEHQFASYSQ